MSKNKELQNCSETYSLLAARYLSLKERMTNAAMRAKRSPESVKLIAVTKTVGIDVIQEAIKAGLRIFGESRVQEAQKKISDLRMHPPPPAPPLNKGGIEGVEWHLIGHLQKNKAKFAVQLFDLIHTIDSIELAEELNRQAEKIGKIQKVLIQVKLSEEETKHGVLEKDLVPLLEKIKSLNNLNLQGLMTMPPYFEDPENVRPFFRRLREIRDHVSHITHSALRELSMGMSNDLEVAIEEGATMVRIGTGIFGERK